MNRKHPVRHRVRSHVRDGKLVSSYMRGSGTKTYSKKFEKEQLAKVILNVPEGVVKNEYLILPNGPSKDGTDWRKGMSMASSWSGTQARISDLKKRGWDGGKILAPIIEQEDESSKGFRVIGSWGKQPKVDRRKEFHYPVNRELMRHYLRPESKKRKKLVWVSPENYLKKLPSPSPYYDNADNCPVHVLGSEPRGYNKETIKKYQSDIFKLGKVKLPPLRLIKTKDGNSFAMHDRYRAKAAYLSAVKKVPVIVIELVYKK